MTTNSKQFPALGSVTSEVVSTEQAAYYLNRKPRTLHQWHSGGTGPIHPARINGRLAWHVARIKELVSQVAQ